MINIGSGHNAHWLTLDEIATALAFLTEEELMHVMTLQATERSRRLEEVAEERSLNGWDLSGCPSWATMLWKVVLSVQDGAEPPERLEVVQDGEKLLYAFRGPKTGGSQYVRVVHEEDDGKVQAKEVPVNEWEEHVAALNEG